MNKFLTKIVGAALGLTLAIGVGVAVGVKQGDSREVEAGTSSISFNNLVTLTGYSGSPATQSGLTATAGGVTFTFDSISGKDGEKVQVVKGTNVTSDAFPGVVKGLTVYGCSHGSSKSDGGFTVYGSTNGTSWSDSLFSKLDMAKDHGDQAVDLSSNTTYTYLKLTISSSRVLKFNRIDVTYETGGQSMPVTVSITGSLTKTTYSKTDSWSNSGLTASGTYDTSSSYTGNFAWSYSPASPSSMNAGDNQDLTITATVSTSGYSGSASITVKVNITAAETSGITNGAKYIIVASSTHYFNGTISGGTGKTTTNKYEGMPFIFTLVDDNTYTIKNGSNFIAIGSDSKTMSYAASSTGLEITLTSSYYYIAGSSGRYLCWYSSNSDIRTYSSNTSYITLLRYDAAEVAAEIKLLSGGWNNNVETNDCAAHYQLAKARVLELSSADLNTFKTSEDTEIAAARTTYQWWCHVNNDDSPWSGAIVSSSRIALPTIENSNNTTLILIVIASISLVAVSGYFVIRRRREN